MDFIHINIITFNIVYSIYKKHFGGHGTVTSNLTSILFIFVSPTPSYHLQLQIRREILTYLPTFNASLFH